MHRHFATVYSRITRFSPKCSEKITVYQSLQNVYQLVKCFFDKQPELKVPEREFWSCVSEQHQGDRLRVRACRHVSSGRPIRTQRDLLWQLRLRFARDSDGNPVHSAAG